MKFIWACASLLLLQCLPARSQSLSCTGSVPSVTAGPAAHILLRAFPSAPVTSYRWKTSVGEITGSGQEVTMWLRGFEQQVYTASVTAVFDAGQSADCSVRVFVTTLVRGGLKTGAGLLVRDQSEGSGYGLYSYLLLGSAPEPNSKERYLAAIRAYQELSPSLSALESLVRRQDLNANFIPVDSAPLIDVSPEWVLNHYDYAWARSILKANKLRGPYLVSFRNPPTSDSTPDVFQDLSSVPPDLVRAWYEEFLNQSAQEDWSRADAAGVLILRLRTIIAVLGLGVPDVRSSLETLIKGK